MEMIKSHSQLEISSVGLMAQYHKQRHKCQEKMEDMMTTSQN